MKEIKENKFLITKKVKSIQQSSTLVHMTSNSKTLNIKLIKGKKWTRPPHIAFPKTSED
jgi:hypothetical protein